MAKGRKGHCSAKKQLSKDLNSFVWKQSSQTKELIRKGLGDIEDSIGNVDKVAHRVLDILRKEGFSHENLTPLFQALRDFKEHHCPDPQRKSLVAAAFKSKATPPQLKSSPSKRRRVSH